MCNPTESMCDQEACGTAFLHIRRGWGQNIGSRRMGVCSPFLLVSFRLVSSRLVSHHPARALCSPGTGSPPCPALPCQVLTWLWSRDPYYGLSHSVQFISSAGRAVAVQPWWWWIDEFVPRMSKETFSHKKEMGKV